MLPKPDHLSGEYGAWFKDPLLAAAYPSRPPYPKQVIQQLAALAVDEPRHVLDIGCGTGDLARRLAPLVDRVDAVDFSAAMLERGAGLADSRAANLRWIEGAVEDVPLAGPYALVTAGESLHWMAWDVVLPRLAPLLTRHGALAIAERDWDGPPALRSRLGPIFARYTPIRNYQPLDLAEELVQRGLFEELGRSTCEPEPWTPTVEDYLECRHSQRGFSRTHMGVDAAEAFDAAIRRLLDELCADGTIARHDGRLQLTVRATVVWGRPLGPPTTHTGAPAPDAR
jgi:SAM-dependent methyltransferase